MGKYSVESGIKVLDRSIAIVHALADSPLTLAELCTATDLPRATAHRLATALEVHNVVARTDDGRWTLGPWLTTLSGVQRSHIIGAATPIMQRLLETTGESVQLYQLTGAQRTCIATQEKTQGLQYTVPVGTAFPLTAGSAAKVFLAFGTPELRSLILPDATFRSSELEDVRKNGWAESMNERENGLSSISAAVTDASGSLVAVLSISGPSERLKPSPAALWQKEISAAAQELSRLL